MKAIVINNWLKDVDEITVDNNAAEPKLDNDQVLVEIKAIGLNISDIFKIQGKRLAVVVPPLPYIPGVEFSGIVIEVGKNCKKPFKLGDKVFGLATGCYAERVSAPSDNVHLIPDGISFEEAAGLSVSYFSSYAALVVRAKLQKDEWILVHIATGGVGIMPAQIAKALGAKVIVAGESLESVNKIGANYAISRNDKDWPKQVLKITGGKGVDVVYDAVGLINPSIKCAAWSGRLVVGGFVGGMENVPTNLILLKNISIVGLFWSTYTTNEPERIEEVWNGLSNLFISKKLNPVAYEKVLYGLDNIKVGLKAMSRGTYGKVVVALSNSVSAKL